MRRSLRTGRGALRRVRRAMGRHTPHTEVCTRRLVVVDEQGLDRIVGEVRQDVAELRVVIPGTAHGRSTEVVLYAAPGDDALPPALGLQVRAEGDALVEVGAWQDDAGSWYVDVDPRR